MSFTEVEVVMRQAGADGINDAADDLAGRAIVEAPIDTGELRASAAYPSVDPSHAATAETLLAMVSFNTVYAHAQHAGEIVYPVPVTYVVREHARRDSGRQDGDVQLVREHTATIGPGVVTFVNHPRGGKDHYLSDPLKAMAARYEVFVGLRVKAALAAWAAKR